MNLQNILKSVGFNDKEAKVYLATLELASATITNIAKKAELPRTTIYEIIEALIKRGIVSFAVKGKTKYFFAEDPERILTFVDDQKKTLQEAMPSLKSIHNVSSSKPAIKFYEGKEGIKTILEDVLKTSKDFLAITSIRDMNKVFDGYFPQFIKERIKKEITVNLLTDRSDESLKLAKKDKGEFRKTRFVPSKYSFHTANFIYDDKIAILSVKKNPMVGIVIEDSDVVDTQRMIFEIIFDGCKG